MRVREPLSFSVAHAGRGGEVECRSSAGRIALALEVQAGGAFSVWLRGAQLAPPDGEPRRLDPGERRLVRDRLRTWLDETGRERWAIEG